MRNLGTNRLSDARVKSAPPGIHHDGAGLRLIVQESGARAWELRIQINGRRRQFGLGSYPVVSLGKARERALAMRRAAEEGEDPRAALDATRRKPRAGLTLRQAVAAYCWHHRRNWQPKTGRYWIRTIRNHVLPRLGQMPVASITRNDVVETLRPMWNTSTRQGDIVRQRLTKVFDFASAMGWRSGENPAAWKAGLQFALPSPARIAPTRSHKAMELEELPHFMAALRGMHGTGARLLEFQILTATRPTEPRLATWEEIDLGAAIWTLPAARTKTKRVHRVPLSMAAMTLLASLPRVVGSPLLFPGATRRKPLAGNTGIRIIAALDGQCTAHGFRSAFSDWANEAGYSQLLVETSLSHKFGSDAERAYRRGDVLEQRRPLMEAWATFCMSRVEEG